MWVEAVCCMAVVSIFAWVMQSVGFDLGLPVNQMSHVFALVHCNIANAVYLQYIQKPENNDGRVS